MGYLIREQSHDSGGKFGGNVYVLQDEAPPLPGNPSNGEAEKTPLPENTVNGENRQRETPSAGFPPQQNKDLTEEEVKTAMELIKEKNIFAPGGADLASLVSAKVVETDTTNYDLVF